MEYKVLRFESLASTNTKAKELAREAEEGTVIVAKDQTQGRGRMGRAWESSKGKGLFMTIILKPSIEIEEVPKINLIAAAAVSLALGDLGIEAKIKWPNDIVASGKKLAGILLEMKTNMEGINYLILGIGINVNQKREDFPEDLREKAGSLRSITGRKIDLDLLLNKILERFKGFYLPFKDYKDIEAVLEINRSRSLLLGREVSIIHRDKKRKGRALDINPQGELVVEFPHGREVIINGEVSVRAEDGSYPI